MIILHKKGVTKGILNCRSISLFPTVPTDITKMSGKGS